MAWSIEINLPENRDNKGTLKMYANGSVIHTCACLGRGSECPDHTQWWATNGDTPTGSYNGTLIAADTNVYSYGPYKRINLEPTGGHALEAAQAGRYGFMIHGGDPADTGTPWYPLRPTHGCIRVSNADQKKLAELVTANGGTGYIGIYGTQKERP
ncbi:hypothetical protein HNQ80_004893 [Anaerosolibacter carboniphilus]|uniref:L,D-TPase catalytic domain-containing protein n=1 Tax=Anaerosolibacter carboniphilus TaxID=1417629 RepID=A0A841L275_9FIRM|nr:L,D-transpeptidase [Anaerosolibacter carboniphilus]MBB6218718.1 hypothetical protein [Anaerosolibacter carboniphilus]